MQHIFSGPMIYIVLLLTPLFWGGAFGATRHVVTELPPLTASALRFLLASLIMVPWLISRGEWDWHEIRNHWLGLAALGATGVFAYNFFFATGLQYTTAINGALVVVVNPVITAAIAVFFMGERWSSRLGVGVLLSLTGVFTVISQGNLFQLFKNPPGKGELLMVGAMVSWSAYTLVGKLVMRRLHPLLATTVSTLLGAVFLLGASFFEKGWQKVPYISFQVFLELLYLAIFATVLAFILYNIGIRRIGASKASAYINLMPVNAVLIAWALYGETVTIMHLLGMALVISGVILTTRAPALPATISQSSVTKTTLER